MALDDGMSYVEGCAAKALGGLNDTRAVEPLIQGFNDRDG